MFALAAQPYCRTLAVRGMQNDRTGKLHARDLTDALAEMDTWQSRRPPEPMLAPARSVTAALAPVSGAIPFPCLTTFVLEFARAAQTTAVAITLRLLNNTGLRLGSSSQRDG